MHQSKNGITFSNKQHTDKALFKITTAFTHCVAHSISLLYAVCNMFIFGVHYNKKHGACEVIVPYCVFVRIIPETRHTAKKAQNI